jgi:hypothetical protein
VVQFKNQISLNFYSILRGVDNNMKKISCFFKMILCVGMIASFVGATTAFGGGTPPKVDYRIETRPETGLRQLVFEVNCPKTEEGNMWYITANMTLGTPVRLNSPHLMEVRFETNGHIYDPSCAIRDWGGVTVRRLAGGAMNYNDRIASLVLEPKGQKVTVKVFSNEMDIIRSNIVDARVDCWSLTKSEQVLMEPCFIGYLLLPDGGSCELCATRLWTWKPRV